MSDYYYSIGQKIAKLGPGNPTEKIAFMTPIYAAGNALVYEELKNTPDTYEYKVTGCRYADIYKELGEPELGFLFVCAGDLKIAEGISPKLELIRTQTIMQGADHCDFYYKVKK